jgi:hypothetical protein
MAQAILGGTRLLVLVAGVGDLVGDHSLDVVGAQLLGPPPWLSAPFLRGEPEDRLDLRADVVPDPVRAGVGDGQNRGYPGEQPWGGFYGSVGAAANRVTGPEASSMARPSLTSRSRCPRISESVR